MKIIVEKCEGLAYLLLYIFIIFELHMIQIQSIGYSHLAYVGLFIFIVHQRPIGML